YEHEVKHRLNGIFNRVYQYAEVHFSGNNFYLESLTQNMNYIQNLMDEGNIDQLRRLPPENNASLDIIQHFKSKTY
ncbi:MAG: hypothetical protein ACN4GM_12810, partial [Gammaproteobacteria bacterium]